MHEASKIIGWTYRESSTGHLDYWLNHALSRMLILYFPDTRETYWAEIAAGDVESTGRGWKLHQVREV